MLLRFWSYALGSGSELCVDIPWFWGQLAHILHSVFYYIILSQSYALCCKSSRQRLLWLFTIWRLQLSESRAQSIWGQWSPTECARVTFVLRHLVNHNLIVSPTTSPGEHRLSKGMLPWVPHCGALEGRGRNKVYRLVFWDERCSNSARTTLLQSTEPILPEICLYRSASSVTRVTVKSCWSAF